MIMMWMWIRIDKHFLKYYLTITLPTNEINKISASFLNICYVQKSASIKPTTAISNKINDFSSKF